MKFNLMILTADPSFAVKSQLAGIDRIFYDLEYINKRERQAGRNTVVSDNKVDGIPSVKKVLASADLLVRVNPIHQYSCTEIDQSIENGADILMLPMVIDSSDVRSFVNMVAGRAKTCIMIETPQAMTRIDSILEVEGIDELFFGLNDLHIGLGLKFMFETLSGGLIEYMAQKCKMKGMSFGFGGIARIGDGILPADNILGEHIRLGSSSVILSRTFKDEIVQDGEIILSREVKKVREKIAEIETWSQEQFEINRRQVVMAVKKITNS